MRWYSQVLLRDAAAAGRRWIVIATRPPLPGQPAKAPGSRVLVPAGSALLCSLPVLRAHLRATAAATATAPARSQRSCQPVCSSESLFSEIDGRDHASLSPMGDKAGPAMSPMGDKPAGRKLPPTLRQEDAPGDPEEIWPLPGDLPAWLVLAGPHVCHPGGMDTNATASSGALPAARRPHGARVFGPQEAPKNFLALTGPDCQQLFSKG